MSRKRLVRSAVFTTAVGATIAASVIGGPAANADPKQLEAAVKAGVGSDTTQDLLNAFAGFSNGTNYTPLQGGTAQVQLISFDATGSSCISTKLNGPSFNRPNGSSAGQRAVSRALDGTGYGNATCGGPTDISGQVDFARSSSLDGTAGNTLTYIPMARDALSFAYFRPNGSPVTTLTRSQLTTIFSSPSATNVDPDGGGPLAPVRILPCGIQTSSGTFASWNTAINVNTTQENTGTTECNNLINPATGTIFNRSQENEGPALEARGLAADAAVDGTQVIIGFSAAAYIAKHNGLGTPNPGTAIRLGMIGDDGNGANIGSPVLPPDGSGANLTPNPAFYNNGVFGRTVYNVVSRARINSVGSTNLDLKGLFSGSTSAVCQAATTRTAYGFTADANCGSLALERGFRSGQL